jgi:hypothetical protein
VRLLYCHVWTKLKYVKSNHLPGTVSLEHGKANENNKPFIASVDGSVMGIFPPRGPEVGILSHQGIGVDIRSVQLEFGLKIPIRINRRLEYYNPFPSNLRFRLRRILGRARRAPPFWEGRAKVFGPLP